MSTNLKWKDKLLSSSFPLEYEAMKLLVQGEFSVSSEFVYSRNDGEIRKDFSVDIDAMSFTPFGNENEITSTARLLVECKYRKTGTSWLFLLDPNQPDYSPFTLGNTIRSIDNFSTTMLPANCVVPFDENIPMCFKGVEIDTINASAHDSQIRHGLSQLQYALPALFEQEINSSSFPHPDPAIPFFICPILLTNAPLYIARDEFSMSSVTEAKELDQIATEAPYLVTYRDISPDFTKHCIDKFDATLQFDLEYLGKIGNYRKTKGEYDHQLPINIIKSLKLGQTSDLKTYFTQYIVCNWGSFPSLITEIKASITNAMSSANK